MGDEGLSRTSRSKLSVKKERRIEDTTAWILDLPGTIKFYNGKGKWTIRARCPLSFIPHDKTTTSNQLAIALPHFSRGVRSSFNYYMSLPHQARPCSQLVEFSNELAAKISQAFFPLQPDDPGMNFLKNAGQKFKAIME